MIELLGDGSRPQLNDLASPRAKTFKGGGTYIFLEGIRRSSRGPNAGLSPSTSGPEKEATNLESDLLLEGEPSLEKKRNTRRFSESLDTVDAKKEGCAEINWTIEEIEDQYG